MSQQQKTLQRVGRSMMHRPRLTCTCHTLEPLACSLASLLLLLIQQTKYGWHNLLWFTVQHDYIIAFGWWDSTQTIGYHCAWRFANGGNPRVEEVKENVWNKTWSLDYWWHGPLMVRFLGGPLRLNERAAHDIFSGRISQSRYEPPANVEKTFKFFWVERTTRWQ